MPAAAAAEAAPILNEWLEYLLGAPLCAASSRTSRLSLGLVRETPACRRKSGPSLWPVAETCASITVTGHSEGSPVGVMRIVAPVRNGSVLEALIRTWYPSVHLVRSAYVRERSSLLLRKPKKAVSRAVQRVRWSGCESIRNRRNV